MGDSARQNSYDRTVSAVLYLKTFSIITLVMAIVAHSVSERGLAWWPDSFAIGSFFGALITFWMWRIRLQRKASQHLANAMDAAKSLGKR
jgi:hypothetical protein